jgi:hypothetical protein
VTPLEVSVLDVDYAQRVILAALDLLHALETMEETPGNWLVTNAVEVARSNLRAAVDEALI